MHLAHQAERQGQGVQPFQPVLQGSHVVAHLPQVGGAPVYGRAGLGGQQFAQSCLGPLDAAGQNGPLYRLRHSRQNAASQAARPQTFQTGDNRFAYNQAEVLG